jgi:hypothetical protein
MGNDETNHITILAPNSAGLPVQLVPAPTPKPKKFATKWLIALALLALLVPVGLLFCVFPWLSQPAFTTVDEIEAVQLDTLRVQLLNHPNAKEDVGPIDMAKEDSGRLLAPLRKAEKIEALPACTFLGEYKVRYADGRRGTIRLSWKRESANLSEAFAAVAGNAAERLGPTPNYSYRVYMKISTGLWQQPSYWKTNTNALQLFELGEECKARGKK